MSIAMTSIAHKSAVLPEQLQLEVYDLDDYPVHSNFELVEAVVLAWEYVLECGRAVLDFSVLPNCAAWNAGVVEHRHTVIFMAPSILRVYDELRKIEDDLPCYDFEIVPAIVRIFDKYLFEFSASGMNRIIDDESARTIARLVKGELFLLWKKPLSKSDITIDDTVYTVEEFEELISFTKHGSDTCMGYIKPCLMTSDIDVYVCDESGGITATGVLPQTDEDDEIPVQVRYTSCIYFILDLESKFSEAEKY